MSTQILFFVEITETPKQSVTTHFSSDNMQLKDLLSIYKWKRDGTNGGDHAIESFRTTRRVI